MFYSLKPSTLYVHMELYNAITTVHKINFPFFQKFFLKNYTF